MIFNTTAVQRHLRELIRKYQEKLEFYSPT